MEKAFERGVSLHWLYEKNLSIFISVSLSLSKSLYLSFYGSIIYSIQCNVQSFQLAVVPGEYFAADRHAPNSFIRLQYAMPSAEQIEEVKPLSTQLIFS